MRVLVTGAGGQLGRELAHTAPAGVEFHAWDRSALDVTDANAVAVRIATLRPDAIVNAAAYTAVDRAESEAQAAYAVNEGGAANLAAAAAAAGALLIHISTDFVFDGGSSLPYRPEDAPNPLNVYGASKLAGERAVLGQAGADALVVRTSWVYSASGSNFVTTMLRLMRERDGLEIVADQIGGPTWARGLAVMLWRCVRHSPKGDVVHWSDAGVASRYDFAVAIFEEATALGLLSREIAIAPVRTAERPTPARRPAFSVLDTASGREVSGLDVEHWRRALRRMLADLRSPVHA